MTIDEQLSEALTTVRRDNAHHLNRLRVFGGGAFLLTLLAVTAAGHRAWVPVLPALAAYLALAVVLQVGGRRSTRILWASRFAIPVFDMPMVFLIQLANLNGAIQQGTPPGHISEFSLSLFACLILLSAFTLSSPQVLVALLVAAVCQQALQYQADMVLPAHFFSLIILGLTTWICIFASRARLRMVDTVTQANARRARLQRYFSPGVGELLEQRNEEDLALGQDCELTIIFTDIRGFTTLSEDLSSREVVELLNAFHARMVETIFRHGGTLDKYLGDGLMAYFNSPVSQPDHAERAVRCSLAMTDDLAQLNEERRQRGEPELAIGIGIHSGRATVGDVGAPHRREFTAIGDSVNVTSRLEQMTKELGHPVLVSETTRKLVDRDLHWTAVGSFPVRGRRQPLQLFTPGRAPDTGSDQSP